MSEDGDTNDRARLMRALIDELRAEPTPELDWSRVEQRLGERVARLGRSRRRWRAAGPALSALGRAASLGAVAASVALLVAVNGPDDTALDRATHDGPGERPSDSGAPGTALAGMVQTGAEPELFEVSGVGSWSLGPHSRAVLRRSGETYVVGLEQGSVEAAITPVGEGGAMVESFAVEVGRTRVAVHGTLFSVTRLGESVLVEVRRGTVAVGPTGHRGLTIGRLLVAPARAEFSLDGGRVARLLAPPPIGTELARGPAAQLGRAPTPTTADDVAPRAQGEPLTRPGALAPMDSGASRPADATNMPPDEPADAPAVEPPPTEAAPASVAQAVSVADARGAIASCLAAFEEGAPGSTVRVTISTQVTLHRGPGGTIASVQFSPPLRPDLQQRCAAPLLGRPLAGSDASVRFAVVATPR